MSSRLRFFTFLSGKTGGSCLVAVVLALVSVATVPASADQAKKPELVLVLSGGGARGAAHIGALKVLEEMHVRPDMVIGTSMGSIIGGLYAAGWSPDEIEQLLVEINWGEIFTTRESRKNREFRDKILDRPYLIPLKLRFEEKGLYMPSGIIGDQSLEIMLDYLEARSRTPDDLDRFPIPFRAIATDAATGEAVILKDCGLSRALRASMAIPGVFSPVELGGRKLVDGGSSANLPIGIALQMGAQHIIAVDISSPLDEDAEKIKDFLSVFRQINALVTVSNRNEDVKRLRKGDVFIRPDLGDIHFMAFNRATDAVGIGEAEARKHMGELKRFSISSDRWKEFVQGKHLDAPEKIHADRLELENGSWVGDRTIFRTFGVSLPADMSQEDLHDAILRVYHLGHMGVIRYKLNMEGDETVLCLHFGKPPYGRNSLQFGLGFFGDFNGDNGYTMSARHIMYPLNAHAGRWINSFQVGDEGLVQTEYYQPFGSDLRWFFEPALSFRQEFPDFWIGDQPWAEYKARRYEARLSLGRTLGRWGEIRLTGFGFDDTAGPRIGDIGLPHGGGTRTGYMIRFLVDTKDSVIFPQHGLWANLNYTNSTPQEDDFQGDVSSIKAVFDYSGTFRKFTVTTHLEYEETLDEPYNYFDLVFLGGTGRLSGLGYNQLYGDTMALATLNLYQNILAKDIAGIRVRFYAGMTLEGGNTFFKALGDDFGFDDFRYGGSLYIGAETPLGPIYLGYGYTDGGNSRVFFRLGDHF